MHQASVYCHFFFVPNRILWPNWENFISGGEDGLADPTFPTVDLTIPTQYGVQTLADYLGLPTGNQLTDVSALPFAAYQKIYQDYYRDENLITKTDVTLSDGTQSGVDTIELASMKKRAWQHDYFTSALPWTQRGPEATIPLGTTAPILYENHPGYPTIVRDNSTGTNISNTTFDSAAALNTTTLGELQASLPSNTYLDFDNSKDLVADLSQATASSINDLRRAFRLQEWLERNARGGARYIEIITAHFGVRSSDARLQRPEFLGGSSTPITISEVLQTSANASEPTPQGNMAGHGVSVGSSNYVSYRAEEHGYIIGIMSVMPKTAYQQGVPKHWKKLDKFDYYWPSFANIGEQPIYNEELYHQNTAQDAEVFGYTPRYAEYKYIPSTVHGTFRSSLNFWHMGRIFASKPTLNADFIECDSAEVERVFNVPSGEEHLYVYLHNEVKATRLMPYFGTPTI
eukprot:TRINITY_DN181_c0_g1_i10.p1 TRINITY_DN181_c0_g1~~TRINITY_DN181_c0_g1_i10.p1  ORF type:complete len:494 (+),score=106.69 TRINITY_DN181_c0_g1_i10:106-1482(+)